uniref:EF-hand domain-containing protein n=1 Tax=Heterorhabditis bacteriophora TaxID=37862 RepID=A0A1I7XC17_HETBA
MALLVTLNHVLSIGRRLEYQKAFSFFDENDDGFITLDELGKAMNKCGHFPSRLELRLIMHHGDNDREFVNTNVLSMK